MESKIAAIYEMGGDVAVSYVLRMNRQVHDIEAEKESLALRLSKLNGTLQEAILKFRNHTSRLETEKDALETSLDKATREKNAAIQEKDRAVSEKNLALEESVKAKAETQRAKNLYEKVAAKAKKADSVNALLR
jgi:DNA repair exonuclease SbcCD ATPase subunit